MSDTGDSRLRGVRLDAREWSYHCEGNAKMTFTYGGTDPRLSGWLLQLDKCGANAGGDADTPLEAEREAEHDAELRRKLDAGEFSASVIGSLVGSQYILPRQHVRAPDGFLRQLSVAAAAHRPECRAATQVDHKQQCLVLVPSMLASPDAPRGRGAHAVTVELKPKWGFLPRSALIAKENGVKHHTCRYCMHQYLKLGAGDVSAYCPLDLFSESRARVAHALDCLSQSPQNNLRVFLDGLHIDDFAARVPRWDEFRRTLIDILLTERVLPRLGRLQQRLDSLDIEGVFPVYQRALASGALSSQEPDIDDWRQAAAAFQRRGHSSLVDDQHRTARTIAELHGDKQAVLEFLLAAVLKDISVMITVESWPLETAAGGVDQAIPEYRIAIVDTEPKQLAKMPQYLDKCQAIVTKYLEHFPSPPQWKTCHE
ncbi:hypothetical protein LPJ61_002365 [Coemansia biformis]|uniref:Inositol-pentakisphosphate 2-kinase n=1 Tax=Coemansia biformis TaxID=1286918 RepID=A0A9W8CZQ9_9FUNG|nr:hypothetical protein LPJ61_002365 [Coemansia biformis]